MTSFPGICSGFLLVDSGVGTVARRIESLARGVCSSAVQFIVGGVGFTLRVGSPVATSDGALIVRS